MTLENERIRNEFDLLVKKWGENQELFANAIKEREVLTPQIEEYENKKSGLVNEIKDFNIKQNIYRERYNKLQKKKLDLQSAEQNLL